MTTQDCGIEDPFSAFRNPIFVFPGNQLRFLDNFCSVVSVKGLSVLEEARLEEGWDSERRPARISGPLSLLTSLFSLGESGTIGIGSRKEGGGTRGSSVPYAIGIPKLLVRLLPPGESNRGDNGVGY